MYVESGDSTYKAVGATPRHGNFRLASRIALKYIGVKCVHVAQASGQTLSLNSPMKSVSFLLLLSVPLLSAAQPLPEQIYRSIAAAQDSRNAAALVPFLVHEDVQVRARAVLAFGSLQPEGPMADTSIIPMLSAFLTDKSHHVRIAAAFALGQLHPVLDSSQRESVSASLAKRLGLEPNRTVLLRVLEALGKMGSEASLSLVVAAGESSPASVTKGEAALAVGRYAYRGIMSKTATAFAVRCLGLQPSDAWKAAAALMRISDHGLLAPHENELVRAASNRSADVRMFIAAALGRLSSSRSAANALLSMARTDKDWRVRVNALRSLARVDTSLYPRIMTTLLRLTGDRNEHVSLTALSAIGELRVRSSPFAPECRNILIEQMRDVSTSQRRKKEAAVALAKLFRDEVYGLLTDQFRVGNLAAESYVAALAYTPTRDGAQHLAESYRKGDAPLRLKALESLHAAAKLAHEDSAFAEIARPVFVDAMRSDDAAVLSVAAAALADSIFAEEDVPPLLLNALRRLKSPTDTEAMVAIIQGLASLNTQRAVAPLESYLYDPDPTVASEARKTLEKITGKSYSNVVRPFVQPASSNADWGLLERIRRNPYVEVHTTKGMFTIKLLPDEAPFTCINFITLVQKKFFDGLTFHRVVPNFVIQGGDPRGDGWGGPGYAIRSEFGLEHFTRGTVGMASAGKDTEGSQWFVTHCFTPHLDGRYTIFGKVVSGMDVVDEIQVGERIGGMGEWGNEGMRE